MTIIIYLAGFNFYDIIFVQVYQYQIFILIAVKDLISMYFSIVKRYSLFLLRSN